MFTTSSPYVLDLDMGTRFVGSSRKRNASIILHWKSYTGENRQRREKERWRERKGGRCESGKEREGSEREGDELPRSAIIASMAGSIVDQSEASI